MGSKLGHLVRVPTIRYIHLLEAKHRPQHAPSRKESPAGPNTAVLREEALNSKEKEMWGDEGGARREARKIFAQLSRGRAKIDTCTINRWEALIVHRHLYKKKNACVSSAQAQLNNERASCIFCICYFLMCRRAFFQTFAVYTNLT